MVKTKAYMEGFKAYGDGLTEDDNPYEEGSQECLDWDEGWSQADYEHTVGLDD